MPRGTFLGLPCGAKIHELCKRADKIIEKSWLAVGIYLYPPEHHKYTNAGVLQGKHFAKYSCSAQISQKKYGTMKSIQIHASTDKNILIHKCIKIIIHMIFMTMFAPRNININTYTDMYPAAHFLLHGLYTPTFPHEYLIEKKKTR